MPEEMEVVSGEAVMSARTVRKRRIAGIFQHYYPEGNALFLFKRDLTLWVPGDFSMLVYRGGVLFHTPFQNDFLP